MTNKRMQNYKSQRHQLNATKGLVPLAFGIVWLIVWMFIAMYMFR